MKRFLLLALIFTSCSVITPLQTSKYISISNLIDAENFEDAKNSLDEMENNEESSKQPKTWYYKGLLSHSIYKKWQTGKDEKLLELYENPIFVAYDSYLKAQILDKSGKIQKLLAPNLVKLANDLQNFGQDNFKDKKYLLAFNAFEKAIKISENEIVNIKPDTNLIYNCALAAIESENWEKAIPPLKKLHNMNFSSNITHLLFNTYLEYGDTLAAIKTLKEGIDKMEDNENLILLLTDVLYNQNNATEAIRVLNNIISNDPKNGKLYFTKGLVYQKTGKYKAAISAYEKASTYSPDQLNNLVNIAICYYNIGVDIDKETVMLRSNKKVQEKKAEADRSFKLAIKWLDKAYARRLENPDIIPQVYELYKLLRVSDKTEALKGFSP